MGNKMKKLICALLASAMLVSSVGMIAFADADTPDDVIDTTVTDTVDTADEADQIDTDEPDDTEVAEPTEAPQTPVVSNTAYDNDSYYQKAISLCSSLGIISGYEDGSVKPDSKVTRAEMASIVLRLLALQTTSKYQNAFTDVADTHWAADQIQTAMEHGIISGMGDGTFEPDSNVTYAQVVVMLVNAMNYTNDAEHYGGWQNGYITAANLSGLELLKNAAGQNDEATDRGVVIKMAYNALLGDYKEISGYEYGQPVYESKRTLAEAKFDILEEQGVLVATAKTTISSLEAQEGQIIIKDKDNKEVIFDCELTGLEDYLAQKITYYYRENSGLSPEVLAVAYDASKSETYEITDLDSIDKLEGFESGEGSIKINGVSKAKSCKDATVIYNGKVVTEADLNTWLADNDDKTVNDLYLPEVGSIKLVKSDKSNDAYDVVFINSYETMIVSSTSTDKLTGKVSDATSDNIGNTKAVTLNLDDSVDRVVTVTRAGTEVKVRNLKKNDVASIKRSLDNTVVDIVVTGESITGTASGVTKKLNDSRATINGTVYNVANIAADDLKAGTQAIFYLDMFDRVAYIETSTADGRLQSGEKYGWIMNAYEAKSGEDYIVQMMTTDGQAVDLTLGSKVDYWGPKATSAETISSSEAEEKIAALISSTNGFIQSSTGVQIRLVKYKTNSANAISRLYCAVDSTVVSDEDALRINPTNLGGVGAASGLVGGYQINDGILEISVPKNASDMKSAENYKFGTVNSTSYVVRENGASFEFVIGEFTSTIAPSVAIKFTDSANAVAYVGDIDTAANNPVMVVDTVDESIDDDDNPIYIINGYSNGVEVSVTTNGNTAIAEINAPRGSNAIGDKVDANGNRVTGQRMYLHTKLWDAQNGFVNDETSFDSMLSTGDVILYEATGDRILKLFDAEDVYTAISEGKDGNVMFGAKENYNTRNMFYFEALEEHELDDIAWIAQKGLSRISFDSSKLMDTIEININTGKIRIDTDGSEISDLEDFDEETKTGDYAFARLCDKGTLQEIIIYRFVD